LANDRENRARSIGLDQQEFRALVEAELEGAEDVVATEEDDVGFNDKDFDWDATPQDIQVDRAKARATQTADAADRSRGELGEVDARLFGDGDGANRSFRSRIDQTVDRTSRAQKCKRDLNDRLSPPPRVGVRQGEAV
jgi:hypothetical protein